jgi:inosose dehydratase
VPRIPAAQVLDEIAATGYAGTELGDWGFLPTDPRSLAAAVGERGLALVGAFVPIAFAREDRIAAGTEQAVRVARLLAAAGGDGLVILSDDNATVPVRTARAGRIRPQDGLSPSEWDGFAARVERVARAIADAAGLRVAFHHHCAGYVETTMEIDALMSRTDPSLVGLCLDTGHLAMGGGDPVAVAAAYGDRIHHVHFKDCDEAVLTTVRTDALDYPTAIRRGVFCELGRGMVPFARVLDVLRHREYSGWIVVEQDVQPGLGTPAESARRNRDYLRRLDL